MESSETPARVLLSCRFGHAGVGVTTVRIAASPGWAR